MSAPHYASPKVAWVCTDIVHDISGCIRGKHGILLRVWWKSSRLRVVFVLRTRELPYPLFSAHSTRSTWPRRSYQYRKNTAILMPYNLLWIVLNN